MTNPIKPFSDMLHNYLWPKDPPDEKLNIPKDQKLTNDTVRSGYQENPLRKRAESKPDEPAWANPYCNGCCTE